MTGRKISLLAAAGASFIFLAISSTVSSCSEPIELKTHQTNVSYLSVDAVLTDRKATYQEIKLKKTIPFFNDSSTDAPSVSGAIVTVSDGKDTVSFTEREGEPGTYYSPRGYYAKEGVTYYLRIERDDEKGRHLIHTAQSTMPSTACRVDKIDYKKIVSLTDTMVTIGIWGQVFDTQANIMVMHATNDEVWPIDNSFGLDTKYYKGKYLSGFPISNYTPSWEMYNSGLTYRKPLESGDRITLLVFTIGDDFYEYYMAFYYNDLSHSIPLIASQPANIPCNITGEDVVGFFATCPVQIKTCRVDDPDRREFKYAVDE